MRAYENCLALDIISLRLQVILVEQIKAKNIASILQDCHVAEISLVIQTRLLLALPIFKIVLPEEIAAFWLWDEI